MKYHTVFILFFISLISVFPQQLSYHDFGDDNFEELASRPNEGLVFNAMVIDDNLNVRTLPSLQGHIIDQVHKGTEVKVIGVSREKQFIDEYDGYWLKISLDGKYSYGWIFSKYVDVDECFNSEITAIGFEEYSYNEYGLRIGYSLDGEQIFTSVKLSKHKDQDYYTFTWDFSNEGYHYSNIPGFYIWNPDSTELEHISYLGGEASFWGFSKWAFQTNNKKFLLQDFGTSPSRNLVVWRIQDGEVIFNNSYESIDLENNTIETFYKYRGFFKTWSDENENLDDEKLEYARRFQSEHTIDQEDLDKANQSGISVDIFIICEYDIDTGTEEIIRCEYRRMM